MLPRVVVSLALMAAAFVPVMSVPLAQRQLPPQPMNTTALNQTAVSDLIDGFLLTLTSQQLQELSQVLEVTMNGNGTNTTAPVPTMTSVPTMTPMPTMTPVPTMASSPTNSSVDHPNQPEKRQFGELFGIIGKNAAKGAAKIGKQVAESAAKRAVAPTAAPHLFHGGHHHSDESAVKRAATPTTAPEPHHGGHHHHSGQDSHDEEKRQLGELFGIIGKNAAKAAAKIGEKAAKSAMKRAATPTSAPQHADDSHHADEDDHGHDNGRHHHAEHDHDEPAPTASGHAKRGWWTPPPIPTPPAVPICWRDDCW